MLGYSLARLAWRLSSQSKLFYTIILIAQLLTELMIYKITKSEQEISVDCIVN